MFGRKTPSNPTPKLITADNSPHRQKATPEACKDDYAAGAEARKNLGKPATEA